MTESTTTKELEEEETTTIIDWASELDSLAYIDNEYANPDMARQVHTMIEEEMTKMKPKNYLLNKPQIPNLLFQKSCLMRNEMNRIQRGEGMKPLDTSRYELHRPQSTSTGDNNNIDMENDMNAWKLQLNNARSQHEHQSNRLLNLELLQTFGTNAWLTYNKDLEKMKKNLEDSVEEKKREIETVNVDRKNAQDKIVKKFHQLNQTYDETMEKNMQIEIACVMLKQDVKRLKTERGYISTSGGN